MFLYYRTMVKDVTPVTPTTIPSCFNRSENEYEWTNYWIQKSGVAKAAFCINEANCNSGAECPCFYSPRSRCEPQQSIFKRKWSCTPPRRGTKTGKRSTIQTIKLQEILRSAKFAVIQCHLLLWDCQDSQTPANDVAHIYRANDMTESMEMFTESPKKSKALCWFNSFRYDGGTRWRGCWYACQIYRIRILK